MLDLEELDEEDMELVRGLMERHAEYTGSEVEKKLLAQWPKVAEKFVKIMPRDFKRVLQEQAEAASKESGEEKVGVAGG